MFQSFIFFPFLPPDRCRVKAGKGKRRGLRLDLQNIRFNFALGKPLMNISKAEENGETQT